jgi:hypothetical protein
MKILNLFNLRTFLVLLISQLAAFFVIHYQIKYNIDFLLFGLAIGFPLAFSIQAAFRRRDRALEYFSLFKGGTLAILYSFAVSEDLSPEKKAEIRGILKSVGDQLILQLQQRIKNYRPMQEAVDKILEFIERNREDISNRNVLRIIRYIRDVTESATYLISLVRHRTMIGLRVYSLAFILIFPIVQAPILYYKLGDLIPAWAFYFLLALGSMLLITLSNFQKMIEYPFDSKGMDNIHLKDFKLDISA